jgi:hypothetical protein
MSKQALISPNEPRETGYRVAQVEPDGQTFEVSQPLFWTSCADNVVADQFWYDPSDNTIKPFPIIVDTSNSAPETTLNATQTIS